MADRLGNTQISPFEAVSDDQLLKLAEYSARQGDLKTFGKIHNEAKNRPRVFGQITAAAELGAPIESVDVTTGMGSKMRAQLSFVPTEKERVKFAERMLDDGEVRAVDIAGKPQIFYKSPSFNTGKWTMVEEYGLSAGDFADIIGEVPRTASAIAAGTVTAPLWPIVQAGAASLASTWTGMLQDAATRFVIGEDQKIGESALRRGKEGAVEGVIDYATLKLGRAGSRLIKNSPLATPADVGQTTQRLKQAYDELENRFNVSIDRTAGVRSGEVSVGKDLMEVESVLAGTVPGGPFGQMSRRLSAIRDQVGDMATALSGEGEITFQQAYSGLRNRVNSMYRDLLGAAGEAASQTKRSLQESVQKRVEALGYRPAMSLSDAGKTQRSAIEQTLNTAKERNNRLWSAADRGMDGDGVAYRAQDVVDRIRTEINGSALPKDERGEVLAEFLTPEMRQIARQATGLENPSAEQIIDAFVKQVDGPQKPGALSYSTIREWRSRVGQRINWNDQTVKSRDLKRIYGMLTEFMEEGEARASDATREALTQAKQHFDSNILPFRDGPIAKILAKGAKEYKVADENVLSELLSLSEVRRLKKLLPANHPIFNDLKQQYVEGILGRAGNTFDGRVDVGLLSASKIDRELTTELFGPSGARALFEIGQLSRIKGLYQEGKTVSPEVIQQIFETRTPQDVKRLTKLARQEMVANERAKRFAAKGLVKDILDNKIPPPDAPMFAEILANPSTSSADIKRMMSLLGKDERAAVQQEYFARILNQADMGISRTTRMSERRAKGMLWDTDKMSAMLRNDPQRRSMRAVLGDDGLRTLENLNMVLHSVRSEFDKGISFLAGRPIVSVGKDGAPSLVFIMTEAPRAVWHRMLSAAYGSKMLTRALSDTKDARQFFQKMVPALMATNRGIEALADEAQKDPRVQAWVQQYLRDSAPREEED